MDKPTDRHTTLLVGRDAAELYLREINQNLVAILRQASQLRAAIAKAKREQQNERGLSD